MTLLLSKNNIFNHRSCQGGIKFCENILLAEIKLHSPGRIFNPYKQLSIGEAFNGGCRRNCLSYNAMPYLECLVLVVRFCNANT